MTVAAALLVALVLAVFAVMIASSQSQDRKDVRQRFDDIAAVSARVTDGIFQTSLAAGQQQAAARLGDPQPSAAALETIVQTGRLAYAGVLDAHGRALTKTPTAPAKFGAAVQMAIKTKQAWLSDVMQNGSKGVVEWAIPYAGAAGPRIVVEGIPTSAFATFLSKSLGNLPSEFEPETAMVDGQGVVLGGVRLASPLGKPLEDSDLLEALKSDDHGEYGDGRYFASGPITGSNFKIVLDTTTSKLYDTIPGSRKTVPWIIFAAFALAALAGLVLLRRALSTAAELQRRELNERHAVEINDNIIQGLALAKYQLQVGEGEASAAQVSETLREAQRLVSGLLGDAEVQAGQLRREIAAETSRPEPPPEDAQP